MYNTVIWQQLCVFGCFFIIKDVSEFTQDFKCWWCVISCVNFETLFIMYVNKHVVTALYRQGFPGAYNVIYYWK